MTLSVGPTRFSSLKTGTIMDHATPAASEETGETGGTKREGWGEHSGIPGLRQNTAAEIINKTAKAIKRSLRPARGFLSRVLRNKWRRLSSLRRSGISFEGLAK
jgi:hypothetical protein